jgi:hypothetical protein
MTMARRSGIKRHIAADTHRLADFCINRVDEDKQENKEQ